MIKKFSTAVILLLVMSLLVVGCSSGDNSNISPRENVAEEFTQKLNDAFELPELMDTNEDYFEPYFEDVFGMPISEVEDYVIMEAAMGLSAWNISMFRMKDPAKTQEGIAAATARAEKVVESFKEYIPEQYEIAQNYIVVENNGYILLAIGAEAEQVKAIFLEVTN